MVTTTKTTMSCSASAQRPKYPVISARTKRMMHTQTQLLQRINKNKLYVAHSPQMQTLQRIHIYV